LWRTFHLAAPPLALAGLLFWFSFRGVSPPPAVFDLQDKALHLVVYAVLAFLTARALAATHDVKTMCLVTVTVLVVGFYGVLEEVVQSHTPSRFAEVSDAMADILGAIIGAPAGVKAVKYQQNRARKPREVD
jgi:VanZ family protein